MADSQELPTAHNIAEVAIVGAGPIGLELAAALKKIGIDYSHFEAHQIAHTISWFPRQMQFFSSAERIAICGVPLQTVDQSKATREEYLAYLRSIVLQFDLKVKTYERVINIEKQNDLFQLRTETKDNLSHEYHVRHVVLVVGDMARPRMLNIPGEDLPHVSHYFEEPHRYFRQRLLVVGGKNSAVEAALRCYRVGAQVSLACRAEQLSRSSIKYWLLPEIEMLIRTGQIQFYPATKLVEITPNQVVLKPTDNGEEITIPTDFVLLMTGYRADSSLFEKAGVKLEDESRAPVFDPHTMETSVAGLYVAGTAAAGTQADYRLFIENCHAHVAKIVKAITGKIIAVWEMPRGGDALPEN